MSVPVQALLAVGERLVEHFFPDVEARDKARSQLVELIQNSDLAQMQVNAVEAANRNLFVAGWRPAAGWVCVAALTYQFIARPLIIIFAPAGTPAPELDGMLFELLFGMLSLAGLRSFEKLKGLTK
jgi:hypothetical protein